MNETEKLSLEYFELMSRQQFEEKDLDYTILEKHKTVLAQLALVGNTGVTVFDLYRKEHVFTSFNFSSLFGYDLNEVQRSGNDYFDSRVHPDDLQELMKSGIALMKFLYQLPVKERPDYKLINEYRILNSEERHVRVIEQHQALELDKRGNVWLSLGVIDISPNQDSSGSIKSQVVNFKTGKISPVSFADAGNDSTGKNALTKREKEILGLIKDGLYSKEISDKLSISIHTVNTHRQRILEKFGVDNSMEAVAFGYKLGLVQ